MAKSDKASSPKDESQYRYPTLNELAHKLEKIQELEELDWKDLVEHSTILWKMVSSISINSRPLLAVSPYGPVAKYLYLAFRQSKYLEGEKEAMWAACYYCLGKAREENRTDLDLFAALFLILSEERESANYVITKALTEKGRASDLLQSKLEIRDHNIIINRMVMVFLFEIESFLKETGELIFDEKIDILKLTMGHEGDLVMYQQLGKASDTNELLMEYLEEKIRANDLNSLCQPIVDEE